MDSSYYRRQLLRKQEQLAEAERKVSIARQKEAGKRSAATKARTAAVSTKTETTRRSKMREADRHESAANNAAKDAASAQRKVATLAGEVASLQGRVAKAEQEEARKERAAVAAAQRRAADHERHVLTRLSKTEADVAELREMRPPKAEKLRILMLAASSQGDLRIGREVKRIQAAVQSAHHRDLIEIEVKPSATTADLLDGLTRFRPHVVHFSGHSNDQLVVFEADIDDPHEGVVVDAKAFAQALGVLSDPPVLVLLNSCRSASQIQDLVEEVVPFAIGMSEEIDDRDAITYAARFYASVADGTSLVEAHRSGLAQMALDGMPGAQLPQLAHATDVEDVTLVVPPGPSAAAS